MIQVRLWRRRIRVFLEASLHFCSQWCFLLSYQDGQTKRLSHLFCRLSKLNVAEFLMLTKALSGFTLAYTLGSVSPPSFFSVLYPLNLEELETLGKLEPQTECTVYKFRKTNTQHTYDTHLMIFHSYILTFLSDNEYIYNTSHHYALDIQEFVT